MTDYSPEVESPQTAQATPPKGRSKVGATWLILAFFMLLLLLLLIFILQNSSAVHINYFGAHGTLSFGVAMLISAVAGSILTLLIGSIRIVQLKFANKKH